MTINFTKRINQFIVALVGVLLLGTVNAYAGTAYSDGRAYLRQGSPTGGGKVYVSTSSSTPAASSYKACNTVQVSETTTPSASAQVSGEKKTTTYHFWAQANAGYKFTGWYNSNGVLQGSGAEHISASVTSGQAGGSDTHAYLDMHASFIKIIQMSFIVPTNGTYDIEHAGAAVSNYASFTLDGKVVLTAHPADGYKLRGWYTTTNGGTTKNYFAFGPTCEPNFTTNVTIGAEFVPDDGKATFWIKGTSKIYDNLNTANTNASSGQIIVVVSDGAVSGTNAIKSGVTLLIPYNETFNLMTTPNVKHIASPSSADKTPTVFRKLTLASGAVINCSGNICIGGSLAAVNGGQPSSFPTGSVGMLDLSQGGTINLQSGAKLYAWGYVKGQDMDQGNNTAESGVGTIVANSGSEVWEDYQVGEWRGGTASSTIYTNKSSWKFFPFQSYTIQNIEAPVTYKSGSVCKCYWAIFGNGQTFTVSFPLIASSDALFKLASGATVKKWYDPTTDHVCFELGGTAALDALKLSVMGESVSSADYNLPIPANLKIILGSGNTLSLAKPMTVHAGAVVEVKSGATLNVNSKVYLYDKDDWDTYCMYAYYYRTYFSPSLHFNRGTGTTKDYIDDATVIVDGTVNVGAQNLYATAHGASIIGNGGGTLKYNTLPSNTTMTQCKVLKDNVSVNIRSANLKNDNESFTKGIASTTFKNVNGRWFTNAASAIKSNKTYDFTYIKSGDVYGTGGTDATVSACYSKDKTGLELRDKWANIKADACDNWWQGIDDGYLYNYTMSSAWHQFIKTTTTIGSGDEAMDVYSGSNNKLYTKKDCEISEFGGIDSNCLYTIDGVKKALINGSFVQIEKNSDDEAYHKVGAATTYYISFDGCNWHPATKVSGKSEAYTVEGTVYIWYNNDWLAVQNDATVGLYYSLSATNVKIYYDYISSAWSLAIPVAEVVTSSGTEQVYSLATAITKAKAGGTNVTIRLLKDMSGTITYDGANNCGLDLNGYTLSSSTANMITVNNASATFIVKDQSTAGTGKIAFSFSANNSRQRAVYVQNGHFILNSGTIESKNTMAYNSTNTKTYASGITVAAGKKLTVNGGTIIGDSQYNPYGIEIVSGSGAVVTINGGTITAHSSLDDSPYGIIVSGGTLYVNGGTIKAIADVNNSVATSSAGIFVNSSGKLEMTGGSVISNAYTTAYGVRVSRSISYDTNEPRSQTAVNSLGIANISGGTITAKTLHGSTAYGIYSLGTTTVSGNVIINAEPYSGESRSTTAAGIYVSGGTTTLSGNATINVTASKTAHGIKVGVEQPSVGGVVYNGTVVVNGGTINVTTTSGETAYGMYVGRNSRAVTATHASNASYYAGNYANAGTATINGGEFKVTSATTAGYGIFVESAVTQSGASGYASATATPKCTVNGGKFKVVSSNSSAVYATNNAAAAANFSLAGGYYNTTNYLDAYKAAGKTVKDLDATVEASLISAGYTKKIAGQEYTVTWKNLTGSVTLKTEKVESGKVPVWTGERPDYKDATSERDWIGWSTDTWNRGDKYINGTALPAIVDHDVTYYAYCQAIYADVTANGTTTRYNSAQGAWSAAMSKTQATIRILTNLGSEASVGNMTELDFNPTNANSIITLDLNGHSWVMGNHSTAAYNKDVFLNVRKAGCKLIVTDNSSSGNGYLLNKQDKSDGILYCASVSAGELVLLGGTLKSINTTAASNSQYAIGVTVASGAKVTMSGGAIHAEDNYTPRALHVAAGGSADVSGGTIKANALNGNAYALLVYGTASVSDEAVVEAVAATSLAYATQCNGTLNVNGGTFKATATGDARGLFASNGTINVDGNPTVTAKATTGNVAVGAFAYNTNGKITIESGTFTATAEGENSNNAYGVRASTNGKVTVNGGTFSVRAYKSQSQAIYAETNGNIDINGGTFTVDQNVYANGNFEGIRVFPGAVVNVTGGTINVLHNESAGSGNAIRCFGGTVNISGNPVFDARFGITINHAVSTTTATVIVDGGTFNCLSWGVQSQVVTNSNGTLTGDVTIWDGKFHSTWNAIDTNSPAANLKIRGGWFTNNSGGKLATGSGNYVVSPSTVQSVASGTPEYTEGYRYHVLTKYNVTWSVNGVTTTQEYNRNETPSYGSTPTISDGNTYEFVGWSPEIAPVTTDVTYTAVFKKYEAEVIIPGAATSKRYEHFTDAWTDVLKIETATIRLLSDVNLSTQQTYAPAPPTGVVEGDPEYFTNATTTLDLNNHKLAYTGTADKFVIVNKAGSQLKVVDNSVSKGGSIDVSLSYNGALHCVYVQKGELLLESGKISVLNKASGKTSRAALVSTDAVLTVTGGTLQAKAPTDARAINSDGNCTVNITGGNIIAKSEYPDGTWGSGAYGAVMWNNGTMNVSGTPEFTVEAASSATGIYAYGANAKFNIDGGTINATTKTTGTARCVLTSAKGTGLINGGTFNARTQTTFAIAAYADTNGKMTINGGTFDAQNALGNTASIWNIEGLRVAAGANVTVNGGTFTASKGASPMAVGARGGTTTINGGTFNSTRGLYAVDYADATQTATVTINGGTFIGTSEAVKVESQIRNDSLKANANVTINGGYFYSTGSSIVSLTQKTNGTTSTLVLNGGKYCEKSGTTYKNQINARKGTSTTITDISETVDGKTYVYELKTPVTVTWKGGSSYTKIETVQSGTTPTNTECTSFVRNDSTFYFTGWTPTPAPVYTAITYEAEGTYYEAEVKIGTGAWTKYTDFLDAWAAVQNSTNATTYITLLNNVELTDKLLHKPAATKSKTTFDLNNFTMTIGGTSTSGIDFNKADAVLTITDGSSAKGGKISMTRTSTSSTYTIYIYNGELKMAGGHIYCQNNQDDAVWHPAVAVYVSNGANAKLTMTGGTVESQAKYLAYSLYNYGTTNISGGIVKANATGTGNALGIYAVDGTATISGGTFNITASQTANGVSATANINNTGTVCNNGTLNVTGGTFNVSAQTKNACGIQVNASGKNIGGTIYKAHGIVNVSGGTFNVTCSAATATQVFAAQVSAWRLFDEATPHHLVSEEKAELNISGGTFTVDTRNNGAFVANGGNVDMLRNWGTLNVSGGIFTIYQKTTPVGVASYRNKATVSGNPVFNINGGTSARGVVAGPWNHADYCDADASNNLAEVEVNGGTFNVKATESGDLTLGAWAYGGLDGTGKYAMNAKLTVNDGEFICINPTANNSRVFRQENTKTGTYGTATAQILVNGGKFKALAGTAEPYATTGTHNVTLPDNNDKRTVLTGGYYVHNTELSTFKADTCKVTTLTSSDAEYANGYRFLVETDYSVKVKSGTIERGFFNLNTALDYAKTKSNPTITLIKNTDFTGPYNLNPTITNWKGILDLNNCTITSTTTTDRFFTPAKADAKLTITDNSTDKGGVWNFVQGYSGGLIGIVVDQGELVLAGGKLNVENTTAAKSVTGVNVWGTSGKFTQTGGTLEVKAPSTATGVSMRGTTAVSGSATVVNVTSTGGGAKAYTLAADAANSKYGSLTVGGSPTITVSGSSYVYGVHSATAGTTATVSGGTFNVTSSANAAYGIFTDKANTMTLTGGTFNVTANTNSAYGINCKGGSTVSIKSAKFTVDATTGESAYGIYAEAANTKVTTESATYNVTAKTTYAYALKAATSADIQVKSGTFNATSDGTNAVGLHLKSSATATIKAGTFKVQSGGTGAYAVEIDTNAGTAAATIEGGSFTVITKTDESNSYWNVEGVRIWGSSPDAVINISGGTFSVTNKSKTVTSYGVRTFSGTVNISGSTSLTAYYALYIANQYVSNHTAYVNISGGTFNSTGTCITAYQMTSGSNVNKADITITGGKFKCYAANSILDVTNTSNLKLQGGYYSNNANNTMENYCVDPKHAIPTTADDKNTVGSAYNWKVGLANKVTFKNGETVMQIVWCESGATPIYSGATPTKDPDVNYTYAFSGWSPALAAISADQVYTAQFSTTDNVASVTAGGNTTYYTTVLAALNYAKTVANPTVTILKNAPLTKKWLLNDAIANWQGILDLNGKTVTGTGTTYGIVDVTKAGTKLTIKDSSVGAAGKITHEEGNEAHWGINIANGATLELQSGTIYVKNTKTSITGFTVGVCVNSSSGGTFTQTGGKVEVHAEKNVKGVYVYGAGNVNISGGEIDVITDLDPNNLGSTAYAVSHEVATATVSINGTADINATASTSAYGVYQTRGTLTVSGTPAIKAKANTNAYTIFSNGSSATANISGGSIESHTVTEGASLAVYSYASTVNITGGTFTAKCDKASAANVSPIRTGINGKMYISDGTFKGGTDGTKFQAVSIRGGTTTIDGGTFTAAVGIRAMDWADASTAATVTINGGTFDCTGSPIYVSSKNNNSRNARSNVTINGGKFKTSGSAIVTFDATPSGATASTLTLKGGYYSKNSPDLTTWCASPKHPILMTSAECTSADMPANSYKVVDAYTLTWTTDGDALTGSYSSGIIAAGAAITAPNTPTKTGYTFDAWSPAFTGTMPEANTTYTATWNCVSPTGLSIASTDNKWDFCAGETMTLTVSGSNIADAATYQWKKWNGTSWDNISGATSASYTTSMTGAKGGRYCCDVTNPGGSCTTQSGDVWVRVWQLNINNGTADAWQALDFSNTGANTGSNTNVTFTSDKNYQFALIDNTGGSFGLNNKTVTRTENAFALHGSEANVSVQSGLAGKYTFTINYADKNYPTIAITYPTANQPANRNIYFDKSVITGWTSESAADIFLRIGKPSHNKNNVTDGTSWTLVPGTDRFYTIKTLAYDGFEAWQIANNASWTGSNSIYLVNTGDSHAITKATNFQKYVVGTSGVTIVPTTSNNTESGCNYWNVAVTDGMLTHTATVTPPTNGTITISNVAQSLSETTTTANIPHRTILTITATPAAGYQLSTLTVNGEPFTSGDTLILRADATISATYGHAEIGPFLDIVDWTSTTVTLNANSWPSNGWPFTINGTSYAKDDRQPDRTLIIPYSGSADDELYITVAKTSGEIYSKRKYTVPHIYDASANLSGTKTTSIVYVHSGSLTINANATVRKLFVGPDAELVVPSGKTLTVDTLVLRTTAWKAASLEKQGMITTSHAFYTRQVADKAYNQFALPLGVTSTSVVSLSNGANYPYGSAWVLKSYSESSRAENGSTQSNWVELANNAPIVATTGYELYSGSAYYREFYFPVTLPTTPVTTVSVSHTDGAAGASNAGWNALCSPLLGKFDQDFGANPEDGIKVSELLENGQYWQHVPETIYPAVPFYYQAPKSGTLTFSTSMILNAPRRAWNASAPTQWLQLTISDEMGRMLDETNIYAHPDKFALAYETGYDVAKQSLEGGKATIYTELACGKLAFAAIPDSIAETSIPVTVYAGADNQYTFSMRDNNYMARMQYVFLHDTETGAVTDLLSSDYTCELTEGTTAGRFYLQCVFIHESSTVTTEVDNVSEESRERLESAQKILYKDKVYILYHGRIYDMTGRQCELR